MLKLTSCSMIKSTVFMHDHNLLQQPNLTKWQPRKMSIMSYII